MTLHGHEIYLNPPNNSDARRQTQHTTSAFHVDGRVMGDVSRTTSTVGTKYISRYFKVKQHLYVETVIMIRETGEYIFSQNYELLPTHRPGAKSLIGFFCSDLRCFLQKNYLSLLICVHDTFRRGKRGIVARNHLGMNPRLNED